MKKIALAFMALLTLSQAVVAKNVTVQTKGMSLVIDVENGKHPTFVYFGHKISDADISNLTTWVTTAIRRYTSLTDQLHRLSLPLPHVITTGI